MDTPAQDPTPTRPLAWLLGLFASLGIRTWLQALTRAGSWADRRDAHLRTPSAGLTIDLEVDVELDLGLDIAAAEPESGPGTPAAVWATTKAAVGLAASPLTVPALTLAALRTTRVNAARIEAFPEHLHALSEGREPPLPGTRTLRAPAAARYLITSDLHRCIPGRLDWPERQRVKDLYASVLAGYGADGWHLIENGDVEDFWMVGGSTWGTVYDIASLTGGAVGPGRVDARRRILSEHLDRIVDNNAAIYELLRDEFCSTGRYHRTMGNHDDVFTDPRLCEHLATHLPGVQVADTILLSERRRRTARRDRRRRGGGRARPPDRLLERSRILGARSLRDLARHRPGRPARGAQGRGVAGRGQPGPPAGRPGEQSPHRGRLPLRRQPSLRHPRRAAAVRRARRAPPGRRVALARLRAHPLPDDPSARGRRRAGALRQLRLRCARRRLRARSSGTVRTPTSRSSWSCGVRRPTGRSASS